MKTVKIYSEIADGVAGMISDHERDYFDKEYEQEVAQVYQALLDLIASPSGTSVTFEIK